ERGRPRGASCRARRRRGGRCRSRPCRAGPAGCSADARSRCSRSRRRRRSGRAGPQRRHLPRRGGAPRCRTLRWGWRSWLSLSFGRFAKPRPASPGAVKRPSIRRQSRSGGPLPRYACHMVRVQLLGEMSVEVGGTRLSSPESRRAWALLAWLALNPGGHARGELAARFWPDVLDSSARASLRSAVWSLRRALGPDGGPHLVASRDAIALEDAWCDAVEFQRLVAAGSLEEALELCQGGDLLAGFEDEWAMVARDEHRAAVADVLGALAGQARDADDLGGAAGWARKRLTLDPLSEDAVRSLMDVLAAAGDRAGALAAYAKLRERFREELAMTPSAETRELAASIRAAGEERATATTGSPLVGAASVPSASPELERARLFEAIVELLEWASFDRPLMLLIEDIHVADAASLELAAYAGRRLGRLPVLMILTRRDLPRPAEVDALEHALRARGVLRLELSLGPLPAPELQRLVSSVASLGPEDVDRVVAASDGNPLLAVE